MRLSKRKFDSNENEWIYLQTKSPKSAMCVSVLCVCLCVCLLYSRRLYSLAHKSVGIRNCGAWFWFINNIIEMLCTFLCAARFARVTNGIRKNILWAAIAANCWYALQRVAKVHGLSSAVECSLHCQCIGLFGLSSASLSCFIFSISTVKLSHSLLRHSQQLHASLSLPYKTFDCLARFSQTISRIFGPNSF